MAVRNGDEVIYLFSEWILSKVKHTRDSHITRYWGSTPQQTEETKRLNPPDAYDDRATVTGLSIGPSSGRRFLADFLLDVLLPLWWTGSRRSH